MPKYLFVGAVPRVLTGLSQGVNAYMDGVQYGATLQPGPGDVVETVAPYKHAELKFINKSAPHFDNDSGDAPGVVEGASPDAPVVVPEGADASVAGSVILTQAQADAFDKVAGPTEAEAVTEADVSPPLPDVPTDPAGDAAASIVLTPAEAASLAPSVLSAVEAAQHADMTAEGAPAPEQN